jgi:hypothetical protein
MRIYDNYKKKTCIFPRQYIQKELYSNRKILKNMLQFRAGIKSPGGAKNLLVLHSESKEPK